MAANYIGYIDRQMPLQRPLSTRFALESYGRYHRCLAGLPECSDVSAWQNCSGSSAALGNPKTRSLAKTKSQSPAACRATRQAAGVAGAAAPAEAGGVYDARLEASLAAKKHDAVAEILAEMWRLEVAPTPRTRAILDA